MVFAFTHAKPGKTPSRLDLADPDAPLISTFLDDLSEIVQLDRDAVTLGTGAHVDVSVKAVRSGTPLIRRTCHALRAWLKEADRSGSTRLFPNVHGASPSADAVQRLLARDVGTAIALCPSLRRKRVTPHVLRHTVAMELLQAGVDCSVIALWLRHELTKTTQDYLHVYIASKEATLARVTPFARQKGGHKPGNWLLAFLDGL